MNHIMNIARRMSDILRACFLFMDSGAKQKKQLFFMEVTGVCDFSQMKNLLREVVLGISIFRNWKSENGLG